jgi:hypothetical protein
MGGKMNDLLKKSVLLLPTLFLVIISLPACKSVTGNVGYQPPGIPIKISIDTNGKLTVSWSGSIQTPIGTFSTGISVDPEQFFPNTDGTLTVCVDNESTVYDLRGLENFEIKLESGYYRQVDLRKSGNNWLFIAVRADSNVSQDENNTLPNYPSNTQGDRKSCPGAPPIRVEIGDVARVLDNNGVPLYMRSIPEVGTNVQWYLYAGNEVKIIDGPVCANDVSFFRVEELSTHHTGWVAEAEADSNKYYLSMPLY